LKKFSSISIEETYTRICRPEDDVKKENAENKDKDDYYGDQNF